MRIPAAFRYHVAVWQRSTKDSWAWARCRKPLETLAEAMLGAASGAAWKVQGHLPMVGWGVVPAAAIGALIVVAGVGFLRFLVGLLGLTAQRMYSEQKSATEQATAELRAFRSPKRDITGWDTMRYLQEESCTAQGESKEQIEAILRDAAKGEKLHVWGRPVSQVRRSEEVPNVWVLVPPRLFESRWIYLQPDEPGGTIGSQWQGSISWSESQLTADPYLLTYYHSPMFCLAEIEALWPRF